MYDNLKVGRPYSITFDDFDDETCEVRFTSGKSIGISALYPRAIECVLKYFSKLVDPVLTFKTVTFRGTGDFFITLMVKPVGVTDYPLIKQPTPIIMSFPSYLHYEYMNNNNTDFQLVGQNQLIRVHKCALLLNGGDYFRATFSKNFKATNELKVDLDSNDLNQYIEFVYLGLRAFYNYLPASIQRELEPHSSKSTFDFGRLYQTADFFVHPILKLYCLYILNHHATVYDIPVLKSLNEIYDDNLLKGIVDGLVVINAE